VTGDRELFEPAARRLVFDPTLQEMREINRSWLYLCDVDGWSRLLQRQGTSK
jgi:hypothetical protein